MGRDLRIGVVAFGICGPGALAPARLPVKGNVFYFIAFLKCEVFCPCHSTSTRERAFLLCGPFICGVSVAYVGLELFTQVVMHLGG